MSKSNKTTAATVAAPKVAAIRPEFTAYAEKIADKQQSLAQICYEAAMFALANNATAEENDVLKAAVTRQQWSDMKKIITCAHKIPASAPKNLVKLAQYIRALDKGATPAQAKQHAEGKLSAADLQAKITGEPTPEPVSKADDKDPDDKKERAVRLPVAAGQPSLAMLRDAVQAVALEYGDVEDVQDALATLKDQVADLIEALANA